METFFHQLESFSCRLRTTETKPHFSHLTDIFPGSVTKLHSVFGIPYCTFPTIYLLNLDPIQSSDVEKLILITGFQFI